MTHSDTSESRDVGRCTDDVVFVRRQVNEKLYLTFPVVSNRLMKMIVQSGGKEIDIAEGGVEDNL